MDIAIIGYGEVGKIRGLRFIEATVESARAGGWVDCRLVV